MLKRAVITTICACFAGPAAAAGFDAEQCVLQAEVQSTQTVQLRDEYGSRPSAVNTAPIPPAVERVLKAVVRDDLAGLSAEELSYLNCEGVFDHIDQLPAPKGRSLFVSQSAAAPVERAIFDLVLYDPKTDKASRTASRLNAKWMQRSPQSQPLAEWIDLYHDGNPVLVFQNIGHNGGMYNAAIYHYLHVDPELDLKPILARETDALVDNHGPFRRYLSPIGKGYWKLTTTLEEPNKKPVKIGYAVIESPSPGSPFQIVSLHAKDAKNRSALISVWADPNAVLVHGYTYAY